MNQPTLKTLPSTHILLWAFIGVLVLFSSISLASPIKVPTLFKHIIKPQGDTLILVDPKSGQHYPLIPENPRYTLEQMENHIHGTADGLMFNFGRMEGTLYFGLINYTNTHHPQPVFYKTGLPIKKGRVHLNIRKNLKGKYDFSDWEKQGQGTIGYRVSNKKGEIIYDGRVSFLNDDHHFWVNLTFLEGPTVHTLTDSSAVIRIETNTPSLVQVEIEELVFTDTLDTKTHEIKLTGLKPNHAYIYQVTATTSSSTSDKKRLQRQESYPFHTAPKPGSRKPFTFAYASDARGGQGGGERNIHGTNAYILKKIMAISQSKGASFLQFTGDMINGRLNSVSQTKLQYRNFKRVLEPFAHSMPVYATMGNHEGLFRMFDDGSKVGVQFDRFPFDTESAESVFAQSFTMPKNGPISEDGSEYDPDPKQMDFPTYKENVFFYTYDNVAMVVLNTNYLFSKSFKYWFAKKKKVGSPLSGGGLHGYLMDQQLAWLEKTLNQLDSNPTIDFIFVTLHTPVFPNGGHVVDDMWYDGNNEPRPWIQGKPLKHGILETRDRFLKLVFNTEKTIALLTGDEHNYARTKITPQSTLYPKKYDKPRFIPPRSLWQINNGAAGAPYYAQENPPWRDDVHLFSTQTAVVLFHIHGKKWSLEVINPDTLEQIEQTNF